MCKGNMAWVAEEEEDEEGVLHLENMKVCIYMHISYMHIFYIFIFNQIQIYLHHCSGQEKTGQLVVKNQTCGKDYHHQSQAM